MSERTYILRDQGVRERAVKALMQLDLGQLYEVVIRPWHEKRSDEQNALFHVLIGKIATATGNSPGDVKSFLKAEFGPKRVVYVHGVARAVPKESSSYTAQEMSEMIDRAIAWAHEEFGIKVA